MIEWERARVLRNSLLHKGGSDFAPSVPTVFSPSQRKLDNRDDSCIQIAVDAAWKEIRPKAGIGMAAFSGG